MEQRKIKKVVSKINFQQAEVEDDKFWRETTPEFRLGELNRLREMYKKFMGISPHAHIEKVVIKRPIKTGV